MHVVVMGCGRVGAMLATQLSRRGHDVAIIDRDANAFRRLEPEYLGERVTGMGFDQQVLIKAGIEGADAFAAVSSGDNSNIIAARVARETFNVRRVVARIYDAKRAEVYERLGIPTVATVPWAAHRILHTLSPDDEREVWRDPTSSVAIVEVPLHPAWIGQRLTALETATGTRVAYLTRFGVGILPTSSTVIQEGDQVFVLATDDLIDQVAQITDSAPIGSSS